MHSSTKIGAGMTFVLPPYICARLRESRHLEMLRENVDFYNFCVSKWRTKLLADAILALRYSSSELKLMSTKTKAKTIYQCSPECEYESTAVPRAAQNQWLALTNSSTISPELAPSDWKTCAEYWKSSLVLGGFSSLPSVLFDIATGPSQHDYSLVADPLSSFLDCASEVRSEFVYSSDICVFEILKIRPEARTLVPTLHDPRSRYRIKVRKCRVVSALMGGHRLVVTNSARDSQVSVDLFAFVSDLAAYTKQLFRWHAVRHVPCFELLPHAQTTQCNVDLYDLPPVVSEPSGALVHFDVQVAQTALSVLHSNPQTHHFLLQLLKFKAYDIGGNGPTALSTLRRVPEDLVADMVAFGAVVQDRLPNGEQALSLRRSAVTWSVQLGLVDPMPHLHVLSSRPPLLWSKLQLVLQLHFDGWLPSPGFDLDFEPGFDLIYRPGWAQPCSYFAALLHSHVVFSKGVPAIQHCKSDAYYKCLLKLSAEHLATMLAGMEGQGNAYFDLMLKNLAVHDAKPELDAEVEEEEQPAPLPISDADILELGALLEDASVAQTEGLARQCVDIGEGTDSLKIWFDNFSGGSGGVASTQRGFCNCCEHGCIKYKPVIAETLEEFCAWMYAWFKHRGSCDSKAAHLRFAPSLEQCVEARLALRLKPF